MTRINKARARNLYNKGIEILLLPCKVKPNNTWVQPVHITNYSNRDFDACINEFECLNCNNELGKYTHFYIED